MVNEEKFFEEMRKAVPKGRFEREGEWRKKAARTIQMKETRVEAFQYGKTVTPTSDEIARVQELIRGANDAAIRIRALANDIITRGEELQDEERQLWERVYQDLVNLRGHVPTQGVNISS